MLRDSGSLTSQVLFKAALVTLSPVLAVAAHINIGFVPLVFIPLYAVQRMAKLATHATGPPVSIRSPGWSTAPG